MISNNVEDQLVKTDLYFEFTKLSDYRFIDAMEIGFDRFLTVDEFDKFWDYMHVATSKFGNGMMFYHHMASMLLIHGQGKMDEIIKTFPYGISKEDRGAYIDKMIKTVKIYIAERVKSIKEKQPCLHYIRACYEIIGSFIFEDEYSGINQRPELADDIANIKLIEERPFLDVFLRHFLSEDEALLVLSAAFSFARLVSSSSLDGFEYNDEESRKHYFKSLLPFGVLYSYYGMNITGAFGRGNEGLKDFRPNSCFMFFLKLEDLNRLRVSHFIHTVFSNPIVDDVIGHVANFMNLRTGPLIQISKQNDSSGIVFNFNFPSVLIGRQYDLFTKDGYLDNLMKKAESESELLEAILKKSFLYCFRNYSEYLVLLYIHTAAKLTKTIGSDNLMSIQSDFGEVNISKNHSFEFIKTVNELSKDALVSIIRKWKSNTSISNANPEIYGAIESNAVSEYFLGSEQTSPMNAFYKIIGFKDSVGLCGINMTDIVHFKLFRAFIPKVLLQSTARNEGFAARLGNLPVCCISPILINGSLYGEHDSIIQRKKNTNLHWATRLDDYLLLLENSYNDVNIEYRQIMKLLKSLSNVFVSMRGKTTQGNTQSWYFTKEDVLPMCFVGSFGSDQIELAMKKIYQEITKTYINRFVLSLHWKTYVKKAKDSVYLYMLRLYFIYKCYMDNVNMHMYNKYKNDLFRVLLYLSSSDDVVCNTNALSRLPLHGKTTTDSTLVKDITEYVSGKAYASTDLFDETIGFTILK